MNVNTKPDKTFKLEMVHPDPSQAHKMPYAPAIKIVGACDLMFLSGATASPLLRPAARAASWKEWPSATSNSSLARVAWSAGAVRERLRVVSSRRSDLVNLRSGWDCCRANRASRERDVPSIGQLA